MTQPVEFPTAPTPKCKCDLCSGEMKYLGETRTVRGPAVRLFRCYECALVTSEAL